MVVLLSAMKLNTFMLHFTAESMTKINVVLEIVCSRLPTLSVSTPDPLMFLHSPHTHAHTHTNNQKKKNATTCAPKTLRSHWYSIGAHSSIKNTAHVVNLTTPFKQTPQQTKQTAKLQSLLLSRQEHAALSFSLIIVSSVSPATQDTQTEKKKKSTALMHAYPTTMMGIQGAPQTTPSYTQSNTYISGTPNSSVMSMSGISPAYFFNNAGPQTGTQQQAIQTHPSGATVPLNTSTGTKLFVGQVPAVCSEDQLYPIFVQFGPLLEVKIMREPNGRSKGSAWVRYVHEEHARAAIAALHERHVVPPQTNPLRVQLAAPSGSKSQSYAPSPAASSTPMIVPVAYQSSAYGPTFYASSAAAAPQQQQQQQRQRQAAYFTAPAQSYQYGMSAPIMTLPQSSIVEKQAMMSAGQADAGRLQHGASTQYYPNVNATGVQSRQAAVNGYCMPGYTMIPPSS